MPSQSPINPFLQKQGFVLLDGGLATELERLGHNLNHRLWSARLLMNKPEEIRKVHLSYLKAGSDCITSASYQASVPGFISEGKTEKEAKSLLKSAVELACETRDDYFQSSKFQHNYRIRPIVAASIGPYGAYLADGSEYTGNYGISTSKLRAFHNPRWEVLADSSADIFACETIPSLQEAEVLRELLSETPDIYAWISFSCKDEKDISDGTTLKEAVSLFENCEQVVAVGINCTAPRYISSLIEEAQRGAPTKSIIVYPNSGEIYDPIRKIWIGTSDPMDFSKASLDWYDQGASLIGGCCRTGPHHIKAMREALLETNLGKLHN